MTAAVGIDIGTTNTKVVRFDRGSSTTVLTRPTPTRLDDLLAVVFAGIRAAAVTGPVAAVGIASMAESGFPLDQRGRALTSMLSWRDTRDDADVHALADRLGADALFEATGVRPGPKPSLAVWLWLRSRHPASFAAMHRWAGVADAVHLALTGELRTDHTLAGRTLAYRLPPAGTPLAAVFDAGLLAEAGLRPEQLPGGPSGRRARHHRLRDRGPCRGHTRRGGGPRPPGRLVGHGCPRRRPGGRLGGHRRGDAQPGQTGAGPARRPRPRHERGPHDRRPDGGPARRHRRCRRIPPTARRRPHRRRRRPTARRLRHGDPGDGQLAAAVPGRAPVPRTRSSGAAAHGRQPRTSRPGRAGIARLPGPVGAGRPGDPGRPTGGRNQPHRRPPASKPLVGAHQGDTGRGPHPPGGVTEPVAAGAAMLALHRAGLDDPPPLPNTTIEPLPGLRDAYRNRLAGFIASARQPG